MKRVNLLMDDELYTLASETCERLSTHAEKVSLSALIRRALLDYCNGGAEAAAFAVRCQKLQSLEDAGAALAVWGDEFGEISASIEAARRNIEAELGGRAEGEQ